MRKYKHVMLLILMLLLLLPGVTALGADTDVAVDKDGDGRISQGYIFVGESHIGMYQQTLWDTTHDKCEHYSFKKSDDDWINIDECPALIPIQQGQSAIFTVVSADPADSSNENYIRPGGYAYAEIAKLITQYPTIEHWNLMICWGTNWVAPPQDFADVTSKLISAVKNLTSEFKGVPTTVYYVTVPSIYAPQWGSQDHANAVEHLSNSVVTSGLPIRIFDVRGTGNHQFGKWQEIYKHKIVTGDYVLTKDVVMIKANNPPAPGQTNRIDNWDGCHVTYSSYQDVFGNIIETIERELGAPKKDAYKPDKEKFEFIDYPEMVFRSTGVSVDGTGAIMGAAGYAEARRNADLSQVKNRGVPVVHVKDNGYVQAFYDGLSSIGVHMDEIGLENFTCINSEFLVWNIWYKYTEQWDKEDRLDKYCYECVVNHWSDKSKTDLSLAYQIVPNAFSELDNAGRVNILRGSNDNKNYSDKQAIMSIYSDYMQNSKDCFYIVQVGGASNSVLSANGQVYYYLLVSAKSDSLRFRDCLTGREVDIRFRDSTNRFIDSQNGIPFGIMDYYRFDYVGERDKEVKPVMPPTPPKEPETWESLTVHDVTVKIPNYGGHAEFCYASDLHLIMDLSVGRHGFFMNDIPDRVETSVRLSHLVNYCNAKGLQLILGGDVVDYASANNFGYLTEQLNRLRVPVTYIRADHDVGLIENPSSWSESTANQESSKIPGTFGGDWTSVEIGGLNIHCFNFSTDRHNNFYSSRNITQPSIVCTHVPFGLSGVDSFTRRIHGKIYNWTDVSGSTYYYGNCGKAAEAIRNIKQGASYIISGHVHEYSDGTFGEDNLGELICMPAYRGHVYHITVTGG